MLAILRSVATVVAVISSVKSRAFVQATSSPAFAPPLVADSLGKQRSQDERPLSSSNLYLTTLRASSADDDGDTKPAKSRLVPTVRSILPTFQYFRRPGRKRNASSAPKGTVAGLTSRRFVDAMHSRKTYAACALYVLGYLLLSVGAYSFAFERWPVSDSLYFAATCFTSVGYGDLCPETRASRAFTGVFALYGISILGIALGVLGQNIVEAEERSVGAARKRVRKRVLSLFRKGRGEVTKAKVGHEHDGNVAHKFHDPPTFWSSLVELLAAQAPNLGLIVLLAVLMGRVEGWSILTSLYYCVITITTVGLGDVSPTTRAGRLFAVLFIPLSVAVLGELLGRVAGFFMDREASRIEHEYLSRELTLEDIKTMDTNGDGNVSYSEFLTFMLVFLGKVDKDTIDELKELFDALDVANSGVLNKQDLEIMAQRKHKGDI